VSTETIIIGGIIFCILMIGIMGLLLIWAGKEDDDYYE
jgi:hypothetical protein